MPDYIFVKPPIKVLKAQGYTCVDMHFHSEYSYDSFARIKGVLKRAKRLGIGVAVTDHNNIKGAQYASENSNGVLVVPGIEVKSRSGVDHLIYFYDIYEFINFYNNQLLSSLKYNPLISRLKDEEIIKRARLYKCFIAAPHPCLPGIFGIEGAISKKVISGRILDSIDVIETINGRIPRVFNKKALQWAGKCQKNMIAGSDAHVTHKVGSVLTCQILKKDEHFLDSLKNRQAFLVGKEEFRVASASNFFCGQLKLLTHKKGMRMFGESVSLCFPKKKKKKQKVAV